MEKQERNGLRGREREKYWSNKKEKGLRGRDERKRNERNIEF